MTKNQFIAYLKQPELLDRESISGLKEIIEDYPVFPAARMLYLRNLRNINSYRFEAELTKHALFIPDRRMLYKLLNVQSDGETEFQLLPYDEKSFDRFFTEGVANKKDGMGLQPTPYQLADEGVPTTSLRQSSNNDLIDKFINENPSIGVTEVQGQHDLPPKHNDHIDDSLITETLAGIYVKQGLYNEAINAYKKLSLKFPGKNSYFASQIEKIKKLISKQP